MSYDVLVTGEDEVLLIKRNNRGVYHVAAVVLEDDDMPLRPTLENRTEQALTLRDALNA